MKSTTIFLFFLLLSSVSALSQETKNSEKPKHTIMKDSVFSKKLNTYRNIKISLPKEYKTTEKYPVIYTLDSRWMFDPTNSEVKLLSDFDIIPKAIVVGIFHKDRYMDLSLNWDNGNFTENSLKFKNFLTEELIPYINSK